jgi:hypothetical protein
LCDGNAGGAERQKQRPGEYRVFGFHFSLSQTTVRFGGKFRHLERSAMVGIARQCFNERM